jgi:hypothetical protein
MNQPTRPTSRERRTFLKQAITLAAGVCCVVSPLPEIARLERERLLAALGLKPGQAARVLDSEGVRQEIVRIAATWPRRSLELAGATTHEQLRATIRRAIQQDYANGNLVRIDGWFLAATEALVLALAAVAQA